MKLPASSLERYTLVGFGAAVALLALLSMTAIHAGQRWADSAAWVAHTEAVVAELEGLSSSLNLAEAARRGFLATGQPSYLQERSAALARLDVHLDTVRELTSDNARQQLRIRDLQSQLAARTAEVSATIEIARKQGLAAAQQALATQDAHEATVDANAHIDQMEQAERTLLAGRKQADERSERFVAVIFGGLLLGIAGVLRLCGATFAWSARAASAWQISSTICWPSPDSAARRSRPCRWT